MVKFKVIKKFIRGKTSTKEGELIDVGTVIDVAEDRVEALKKLEIINKPVRPERKKKKE